MDDGFGQEECELGESGSASESSSSTTTTATATFTSSTTTAGSATTATTTSSTSSTQGTGTGAETESDTIIDVTATDTDGSTGSSVSDSTTTEASSTTDDSTTTGMNTVEFCVDADGDGFGNQNMCQTGDPNDPPPGTVPGANGYDCDDGDADTFPGAAPNDDATACMTDVDDDDYGDETPAAGVTPGSDCNDAEAAAWRCVLLVTQDGTPDTAYDEQILDSLQAMAFDVTVVADTDATVGDADGEDLVVISETAHSTDVGGTFRDVVVPVLCMEGLIWDDMDMAAEATGSNVDTGTIVDAMSPLAGGQTGTVAVVEGQGSGTLFTDPNDNATDVLHFSGAPGQAIIFAFDTGATMENTFVAPARRMGMGYDHDRQGNSATLMTDAGVALFEAAVVWLMG